MSKNDGGPAFPFSTRDLDGTQMIGVQYSGMSLRDWFAGQALVGLIEGYDHEARCASANKNQRTGLDDNPHQDDSDATYASQLAGEAYILADALLKAREP